MTDDQIRDIVLSNFPRLATTISWHEVSQFARALLSASKPAAPAQSGEPIGWAWKPRGGSLDFSDAQDRPSEIDFQHAKAAGGEFVPLFVSPQPSPTAVVLDDERAAFAAWWRKHGCVAIEKTWTEDACWFAWQARAASPQPVETGDATQ